MTSTGEREMRRRIAERTFAGPSEWQAATRRAIEEGYAPIPEAPWRPPSVWRAAMFIALSVFILIVLVTLPVRAQPESSTQNAAGIACNAAVIYDASTNGVTQLVAAGPTGEGIYICGYSFFAGGTVNVSLVYGTGTNCGTGTTKITPAFQFIAQTGMSDNSPFFRGMFAPSGKALCINASAGQAVQAVVYYARF